VPVVLGIFAHGAAKVIDGVYVVHILFEHKNLLLGILSLFLLFYLRILLFSNFAAVTIWGQTEQFLEKISLFSNFSGGITEGKQCTKSFDPTEKRLPFRSTAMAK
jgi:hypothetical protein